MNINIRQATEQDKDFIMTAIIEAEKSGADITSYGAIFSLSGDAVKTLVSNILDEGIEEQEMYIPNFLVAEVDGENAAAVSAWIEGESGMTSNIIKANMLAYFLNADILEGAVAKLGLMNEVNISREMGALQLECIYTAEKFRGMGLSGQLINEHIKRKKAEWLSVDKAQIILLKNNSSALMCYEKVGFAIVAEKKCEDEAILKVLPCDTKILMERKLNE